MDAGRQATDKESTLSLDARVPQWLSHTASKRSTTNLLICRKQCANDPAGVSALDRSRAFNFHQPVTRHQRRPVVIAQRHPFLTAQRPVAPPLSAFSSTASTYATHHVSRATDRTAAHSRRFS
jgi:hypothetical protein